MPEVRAHIAIGTTDCYRYLAVRPPLKDYELDELVLDGFDYVEQLKTAPECSQYRYTAMETDELMGKAQKLTIAIAKLRGSASLQPGVVRLYRTGSSPFNPTAQ